MKPDRFRRIMELFDALRSRRSEERAALLEDECREDPELRACVESLLLHDRAGVDGSSDSTVDVLLERIVDDLDDDENVPEQIGPYRILEMISKGGMGAVYLAESTASLRRKVALKLIQSRFDSDEILGRFASERETLALMKHPNIAAVYDAGTGDGRPYFVMEYVEGMPLTRYCDTHRLGIHERLRIFLQVCQGVQHAHDRGVIHRDLKPENILVTRVDEQPVVKIIDFGIAKVTHPGLVVETIQTLAGQVFGTPAYMSPEQTLGDGSLVDLRTDIYSLGVVLYELVVGLLPLDEAYFRQAAIDEIVRRIREDDPLRPSVRLARFNPDGARKLAAFRGVEPGGLLSELRGDVDWIAMRALEKEKSGRYESVRQIAENIEHHLAGRPIPVGPPGPLYRARKFVRRHRGPVAAVTTIILLLVAGLVVTSLLAALARQRLTEVYRLTDLEMLSVYREKAEALWPATPDRVDALRAWLEQVAPIAERLPTHRMHLERLRDRARPRREAGAPWEFADSEDREEHRRLDELVKGVTAFIDEEKGTLGAVRRRLERATSLRSRSIDAFREEWRRARDAVATSPAYGGLEIEPQLGLVPLGADPVSDLQEFACLLDGGEIPARGDDGRLQLDESSAIVFVLIPGGTFVAGVDPSGVEFSSGTSTVARVLEGSMAAAIGLRVGDLVEEADGRSVTDAASLQEVLATLDGATVRLRVRRDGDLVQLSGPVAKHLDPYSTSTEEDEWPARAERIEPFFLSKYEMTQAQWLRFTGENPSTYGPDGKIIAPASRLQPVESVSWHDCKKTLQRLGLVLPGDLQWEYCVRAGTSTIWWTGQTPSSLEGAENLADEALLRARPGIAITRGIDDGHAVHSPVGSFRANAFGLHDMAGNVSEWCEDLFSELDATRMRTVKDAGVERRVVRGGGWSQTAQELRSANRGAPLPSEDSSLRGLRPARELDRASS